MDLTDSKSAGSPTAGSALGKGPDSDAPHTTGRIRMSPEVRLRRLYRLVMVLAVCPILIWAVRFGLNGWEPTWDVATTVVRIRDVFSAHPPLTGMAALPSSGGDSAYSFPGALHLYLLAVPVKLLGTTWGVLLGMAVINTAMGVTAIWLVRRRLGERWAIVGALFFAALLWTIGGAAPLDAAPIAIGVIPLFTFLVAAWSVADGDGPALVVFAFVGNYLFLNQLVFVVVVPVVGGVALFWVLARRWRERRRERRRVAQDAATARRGWRWWLVAAGVLTFILWIPPLVDQFILHGGNLGHILDGFGSGQVADSQAEEYAPSLGGALGVLAAVTAVLPAWLPPSFTEVTFDRDGGGTSFLVGSVSMIILFALLGWGAWRAQRRGDTRVSTAVVVAVTGWLAYLITAMVNPDPHGYYRRYFLGLWPLAAFMWMVAAIGVGTGLPRPRIPRPKIQRIGLLPVVGALVVVTAITISRPSARPALWTSRTSPLASELRHTVAHADLGPGPILVWSRYESRRFLPSVLLGLQDAGIPFRVRSRFDKEQFGASRGYVRGGDAVAMLRLSPFPHSDPAGRLVAEVTSPPVLPPDQFDRIDARMREWSRSTHEVRTNPAFPLDPSERAEYDAALVAMVAQSRDTGDELFEMPHMAFAIRLKDEKTGLPLVEVPGLTADEIDLWFRERARRAGEAVYLYLEPMR